MAVISKLNKDCLMAIFKWISFQEQFVTLRLVCRLWKEGVEKMFRSKKSLTLISDEYYFRRYPGPFFWLAVEDRRRFALKSPGNDDHLQISFTGGNDPLQLGDTLAILFPQVEKLFISFRTMTARFYYTALPHLLNQWCKLKSLTIAGTISLEADFTWLPLFKALNSLKSLVRLDLYLDIMFDSDEPVMHNDFKEYSGETGFIRQLEHFLSNSSLLNTVDNILPLFSSKCKRLHPWVVKNVFSLEGFPPTLTHLALYDLNEFNFEIIPLAEVISNRFTSLQFLDLYLTKKELSSGFFRHLRKLNNLKDLCLMEGVFNLDDNSLQVSLPTVERLQLNRIKVTKTANNLSTSNCDLLGDRLSFIFPRVVHFEIDSFENFPQLEVVLENKQKFANLKKIQTQEDVFIEYGMQSNV